METRPGKDSLVGYLCRTVQFRRGWQRRQNMDDRNRRDQPDGDFGATMRLPPRGTRQLAEQAPRQPQPPTAPKKRGIPLWVWLGAGGALLVFVVLVALVVSYFLFGQTGFTLVVRGAPPGSDVYVD